MPEKVIPQRISVDIDNDDGKLVKIKWRRELPWGPAYSVPRGMLEDYSARARERLEALVTEAMRGNVKRTGAALKELAEAGYRLYRALFYDPEGGGKAGKMRDRLKNLTGEYQIFFSMGVPMHIPWGLVYDGDLTKLTGNPEDWKIDYYRDFWCIKYGVASVYYTVDPERANKPLPAEMLRIHSIANKTVLTRTGPYLATSGAPSWEWVVERFGPPLYSQKDWLARWTTEYDKIGVLFVYSHADGSNIGLETDTISANDLAQDLADRQAGAGVPCLVFLNGCSTAVGDPKGGFLEATASSRFCGFIGAEASIPEVYALRFGAAFLYDFVRGENTVLEIMQALRERHWPLSLLYNVYCVPDMRVKPGAVLLSPLPVVNFCDFDLGTQGI